MKRIMILGLVTGSIGLSGCNNAKEERELAAAKANLNATIKAQSHAVDAKVTSVFIDTVGLWQGESIGRKFMLDCYKDGYYVTFGNRDANGFSPFVISESPVTLSNRRKAECGAIVARQNKLSAQDAAKKKAEEKRKDEAYDKAHAKR